MNKYHSLILNMHQPNLNLENLIEKNEWEAKEILFAYDRMPRSLWEYSDIARINIVISGTLLESLSKPDFQNRVYGIVDCGKLIWHLQNQKIFNIIGTGYYHPVFPLIPEEDWDDHIDRWLLIAKHLFWREEFNGFWPPEMGFDMKLIPHLKKYGYKYVIVDSEYIDPIDKMSWQEIMYRPHYAKYNKEEIIVIVRDRELSNAQLSGMDYQWFEKEVNERTKYCELPPLLTTATDGDNGGWFRNQSEKSNFWNYFYKELLENIKCGYSKIKPIFINEYISKFGIQGEVKIRRGAWNTDIHHGWNFHQWQGSQAQRDTMQRIHKISKKFHSIKDKINILDKDNRDIIEIAKFYLLRSETSCNFYWGEDWLYKANNDLDQVELNLNYLK